MPIKKTAERLPKTDNQKFDKLINQLFSEAELNMFRFPDMDYKTSYIYVKRHNIRHKFHTIPQQLENWIEIVTNYDFYLNRKQSQLKEDLLRYLTKAVDRLNKFIGSPNEVYSEPPIDYYKPDVLLGDIE